ncbi:hypothetical protein F2Q69_00023724 [Brassica cretica]|uniref:Uncharacterized protein n=1 Tax=Brassica cretica TaxID=69181 RepID=A0A8S9QJJ7_BRACR|nr:hypothetical protein F2Q69_00023724 [Brassica cretica]
MERGVCFSFFIGLYSCGAVSTGPEDTTEITSVVLVDESGSKIVISIENVVSFDRACDLL